MLLSPQSSPPWELTVSVKIPRFSVFPSTSPSSWFLDSGASNHMTSVILKPYVGHEKITAAIGQNLTISGIGSLNLSMPHHTFFHLPNVYFVPELSANLFSVGHLVDNGYSVHFSSFGCLIKDQQTWKVIKMGTKRGRLFYWILDIGCLP